MTRRRIAAAGFCVAAMYSLFMLLMVYLLSLVARERKEEEHTKREGVPLRVVAVLVSFVAATLVVVETIDILRKRTNALLV